MTLRVRHVIPTVGSSAREDLQEAQRLTVDSIRTALSCTRSDVAVEVHSVHFADETVDIPEFTDAPVLTRSIMDVGDFAIPRRLPLMQDVLTGFGDPSEFDVAILTNADICVQPLFYDLVSEIVNDGYDAFSITRRTVHPPFRGSASLARLSVTSGTSHPGHDCFVFRSGLLGEIDVGHVSFGVRYVARAVGWSLQLTARNYRVFSDLHATFHVGDDRVWVDPRFADYDLHGIAEAQALVERLVARYGRDRVERLAGVENFLQAMDEGSRPSLRAPSRPTDPGDARDRPDHHARMIFTASSGRSGTQFLATLLGSARRVDAGHEREPTMAGAPLRRIAFEDPLSSYEERLAKVAAIRQELAVLPPRTTYVDSSHMFVKTHADVVFDSFEHRTISVVVLRRDPVDVARSLYELGVFSVDGRHWPDWMPSPTAPFAAFRLDEADVTSRLDLIFGYLVDTETRTRTLRERTPEATWVDTTLESITTVPGALQLFAALDLQPPGRLRARVQQPVNDRTVSKTRRSTPIEREAVEDALHEFLGRFAAHPDVQDFIDANGTLLQGTS